MIIGTAKRTKEVEKPLPTRHFSAKQEAAVAKATGGKRTPNSGATPWSKGDVLTDGHNSWLIECKTKTTTSESISIKRAWLNKLKEEALFMCKERTAVAFNFGPDAPNYYIIEEWQFQEYLELLRDNVNKE